MITLLIRRPDIEETALSPDEMLVALRDGVAPVGEAMAIRLTADRPAPEQSVELTHMAAGALA